MGIEAIGPKLNTSKPAPGHKIYPYLLRNLSFTHSIHVWQTDLAYVPMAQGFFYLMTIIDVKSRYVLNWSLSNTMDKEWCTSVFLETVHQHGSPEILNTDQGSQFTSDLFIKVASVEAGSKM